MTSKKCKICGRAAIWFLNGYDHSLCYECNTGLWFFSRDVALLKKAIFYLRPEERMS